MSAAYSIVGATALGSVLGLLLKSIDKKTYALITAAAAGVMLCASIHGLLLSAVARWAVVAVCAGMLLGAALLHRVNRWAEQRCSGNMGQLQRLHGLLFVFAIAVHHFPEGLAAGVSFGSEHAVETVSVCTAIALQNIPEAMMVVPAMGGFRTKSVFAALVISGGAELLGLMMGYYAVQISVQLLPLLLALAAGAMLYVVFVSMLPDAYEQGREPAAGAVLCGYCGMLLLTAFIEWLI